MPTGVIRSSARIAPTKAAAQPSRSPAKITGLAAGRMMRVITWRRLPRNERPISRSEIGV